MSELARFQQAFAAALAGEAAGLAPWLPGEAEPRLSVYRNTVAKGCADAICAQFPTVLTVVGEAWLRDAGLAFARAHPPASASLADYGEAFPDWLAGFPPAADMPWLADIARLDRLRTEALFAADAAPLPADALAGLGAADFATHGLALHPATRWRRFQAAVPALWLALQAGPAEAALLPTPQAVLVTRPHLQVQVRIVEAGACALLDACAAGASLASAGEAALAAEPGLDLAAAFAELIAAGAFAEARPIPHNRRTPME
jgi:hypothetical protein